MIIHLSVGREIPVTRESDGREVITGVDHTQKTFRVLGASRAGFALRTISYLDGTVLQRQQIPTFSSYYLSHYAYGLGFAISPGATRVAYVEERSASLCIFDIQTRSNFVLNPKFTASIVGPPTFLEWISDNELLAAAEDPESHRRTLTLYNAAERSRCFELPAEGFQRCACALSPTKESFAYWERGADGTGVFTVLNLKTRRVLATIRPTSASGFLSYPAWSEDGRTLVYQQDGALSSFDLPTASQAVLKERPSRKLGVALSYTPDRVLCKIDPHDGFPKRPPPLYVLQLPSGAESVIAAPEIRGEILAAEHGTIIIYGMGQ